MYALGLSLALSAAMMFPLAMGGSSEEPIKKEKKHTGADSEDKAELRDSVYYIDVISATWGMNCHGKERISNYGTMDLHNHGNYEIEKDNILTFLQEKCNDKQECEIKNIESFYEGVEDPAVNCKKELELSFRCFNYDVARPLKLKNKRKVKLDCNLDKE